MTAVNYIWCTSQRKIREITTEEFATAKSADATGNRYLSSRAFAKHEAGKSITCCALRHISTTRKRKGYMCPALTTSTSTMESLQASGFHEQKKTVAMLIHSNAQSNSRLSSMQLGSHRIGLLVMLRIIGVPESIVRSCEPSCPRTSRLQGKDNH